MDPIRIPSTYPKQLDIHWVSATESPEFGLLSWALTHSSIVALDAEWKPRLTNNHSAQENETNRRAFPHVSILQLACRLVRFPPDSSNPTQDDSLVFLLDLQTLPLASVYDRLKEMFVSQNVLKLGFRFKQDLTYLSSTFCSHGFEPGFDRVEPFIDISNVYNLLQPRQPGRISRNPKSLAAICEELLGVSISKEVQCSDWSQRPLTEEQKMYAAIDAHCLLEIFTVFQFRVDKEGGPENDDVLLQCANSSLDTNLVREKPTTGEKIVSIRDSETSDVAGRTSIEFLKKDPSMDTFVSGSLCSQTIPLDESPSEITGKHGSKILLEELDKRPRPSRMRAKKQTTSRLNPKAKSAECVDDWQGPIEFLKKDPSMDTFVSGPLCSQTIPLDDESLSEIMGKYGSKILLEESDKRPRPSRMRAKKQTKSRLNPKAKTAECVNDWQGPVPWDISKGGDGRPKFLCDTTLEGLAKYLRCVGIDAAVPHSKKHVNRKLIGQALGDKRLLLTRDAKLLRYKYLIENQIYIVKNLGKDKQLNEVIKTFHLKILEDQILSRCTKCNGTFIQRPLTTEEAIKAAEGFQKIPDCVLNKNLEFWLCMHCRQVYWKLDSAKQKFRKFCDLIK